MCRGNHLDLGWSRLHMTSVLSVRGSAVVRTGADSPVSAASCVRSASTCSNRTSAGTRSPAASATTSPRTTSSAGTSSHRPPRRTVAADTSRAYIRGLKNWRASRRHADGLSTRGRRGAVALQSSCRLAGSKPVLVGAQALEHVARRLRVPSLARSERRHSLRRAAVSQPRPLVLHGARHGLALRFTRRRS